MMTISEGATAAAGELVLSGEADAYGHRKLGGIGQLLGRAQGADGRGRRLPAARLPHALRQPRLPRPDGGDELRGDGRRPRDRGRHGRMVSLRNGSYTTVPISATREGVKRVDVDELYDAGEYRPKVRHVLGKPMFLY